MSYRFKEGRSFGVPAQVVGERLEMIRDAGGGFIAPIAVVEDARPAFSPLHRAFEWNDVKAAEEYRVSQAARLIRSVVVVRDDAGDPDHGVPRRVQAYVAVGTAETGSRYTTTAVALSDDEMRERVLADAMRQIRGWNQRFGHMEELAAIVAVIRDVEYEGVA